MFGRKKLVEAPLYYWEERSFMMVVPPLEVESDDILRNAINGISSVEGVNVIENNFNIERNCIDLKLKYLDEIYEVGFFVGGINVPDYYLKSYLFTDEDRRKLLNAKKAVTLFMNFGKNAKVSFQLQLKLALAMVPDFVGILDESAEKMIPGDFARMIANAKVLPSARNLFSVQAVGGENGEVWLHTHGLCRCGLTELEILDSNSNIQQSHFNLLNTYAMYLIDHIDYDINDGAYIGQLIDGSPVVATCRPWTEGVLEYKNIDLGGVKDRKEGHNSWTSIVFLYTSEDDEEKRILRKISIYDKIWGENPLFFFSDEETKRMKEMAIETFDYVKKGFKNKENEILLKIGLPLEEKGKFEHIWFKLLEIKGNKIKARLTQEPYYLDDIHEGYEAWYTVEDITDWVVYTKDYSVNPDTAYLLDRKC